MEQELKLYGKILDVDMGDILIVNNKEYFRIAGIIKLHIESNNSAEVTRKIVKRVCGLVILELLYNSHASDKVFQTLLSMLYQSCVNSPYCVTSHDDTRSVISATLKFYSKMPCIQKNDLFQSNGTKTHGFCIPDNKEGPGSVTYSYQCVSTILSLRESLIIRDKAYSALELNCDHRACSELFKVLQEYGYDAQTFDIRIILPHLDLKIKTQVSSEKSLPADVQAWIKQPARMKVYEKARQVKPKPNAPPPEPRSTLFKNFKPLK